jgi:hypothetical protein
MDNAKKEEFMRSLEEKKKVKTVVEALSNFVNNYSCPNREFAKQVMNEHRTLQQGMMRLFIATIEEWAKQEYYDLRNEDTIMLSRKIVETIQGESYLRFV